MNYSTIIIEIQSAIAIVTINRPEKLNALNQQTLIELNQAFDSLQKNTDVRVVVLTGAGQKAFAAGADIAEMQALNVMQGRDFSQLGQNLMRQIEKMNKPVIGMINGFALGGGLELAMACHLRIASSNAHLGQPEVKLGLIPGFGGTQRLARLIGRAAALELCLIADPVNAERAQQLGLVMQVCPISELHAITMKIAQQLAELAPFALRGVLECIQIGMETPIEAALEYETTQFGLLFSTQDMKEGTSAFLERRKPQFTHQ